MIDDVDKKTKQKSCFKNNTKLKRANIQIPYSKEQLDEYLKCRDDILYFMKHHVKIISLDKGLVKFDAYEYQKEMIKTCHDNRFSIFMLARQMGKTTTIAAYLLYTAIFTSRYSIAILANKGATAREILDRIKKMFEELPWYIKPGIIEWNKGRIELSNGSRIFTAATTSSSIRGQSINLVYIDEMAFIQNDVEFYTSTYPVITSGQDTKIVITSTPKGLNLFHKIWSDAVQGKNNFVYKKYIWSDHPERNEKWKQETIGNTSLKQFSQEHLCVFEGSSDTLISGTKLQQLTMIEPIVETDQSRFRIFELPIKERSYVATVDVAEGIGQDYSVISIIDVTKSPYNLVAVWRDSTVPPVFFTAVLYKTLLYYNEAYCVVESNSIGKIVADSLYYDYDYDNVMFSKMKDHENIIVSDSPIIGLRQNKKTKSVGCAMLKTLIESDVLIVHDEYTIQELSTFSKKGSSWQAESGKTDDIVMTLVLFGWLVSQPFFSDLNDSNIRDILIKRYLEDSENEMILGFFDDGINDNF